VPQGIDEARSVSARLKPVAPFLVSEIALVLVLLLGDIGFDRPGRFGLDFGHLLLIAAAFAVLWSIGTWRAVRLELWPVLCLQILIPLAALAGLMRLGTADVQRFRAEDYQHLVGDDEHEVQAELGDVPGATTFTLERDGAVEHRELQLNGMTVRYSGGKVVAVEPNER
jgi:hypothetical protein